MELSNNPLAKWLDKNDSLKRLAAVILPGPAAEGVEREENNFLPDFCGTDIVLKVALIAEMLALVITLVTRRISVSVLQDFLLISIFVQWIALSSVAVLCGARRHLSRLSNTRALVYTYLLLLGVTLVVGECALWLLAAAHKIESPHPEWYLYFHVQNLSVSAIVNALALHYFFAKHELKQRTVSEARAHMQALQSRIRPHFLFNSMNIIASLIRTAPAKAEEVIEDVADLFRMMLGEEENLVPVKNEIAVAKKYLVLEGLRLDNRLRVEWEVGTFPRRAVMPVLTLQPLLENAIYHCVEPATTGAAIKIRLWEEKGVIHINVSSLAPLAPVKPHKGHEMALDNVRQRFESHYGSAAKLELSKDNGDYRVIVSLPARGGKV